MAYARVSDKPCHYVILTLTLMIFLVARVRITIQLFNEPVQISQGLGLLLMAYSRVLVKPCHYVFLTLTLMIFLVAQFRLMI